MSMHIEDLVRAAQERQAARSVSPDRIRAALPARAARAARRRRMGALAAVAGTAVLVAVVSVPLLTLRGAKDGAPDAGATSSPGSTGNLVLGPVPMWYRPTWLPDGFVERLRSSSEGRTGPTRWVGLFRAWTAGGDGTEGHDAPQPRLGLIVHVPTNADDSHAGGRPVDINGIRGYYDGTPGTAFVRWRADADHVVEIGAWGTSLSEADLLRIARSVQPDTAQFEVPLRLGWLPAGLSATTAKVHGATPAAWRAGVNTEDPTPGPAWKSPGTSGSPTTSASPWPSGSPGSSGGSWYPRQVSVEVGPTGPAPPGGESLTVGGRPARLARVPWTGGSTALYLVVELDPEGRVLTVFGAGRADAPITRADVIRVAENVTVIDPAPVDWIGTR